MCLVSKLIECHSSSDWSSGMNYQNEVGCADDKIFVDKNQLPRIKGMKKEIHN